MSQTAFVLTGIASTVLNGYLAPVHRFGHARCRSDFTGSLKPPLPDALLAGKDDGSSSATEPTTMAPRARSMAI
ncbi:hypothetical protein D9615_007230 [Tricholomella constricta]|uniref:Uncharacterized protein n=1 Tax=Tricholomella constricta TaxID=117010 RepID=A0A8H5H594_9AGAR|nr:hypothetical protein D9615_007230 [Tricholomella constricta]